MKLRINLIRNAVDAVHEAENPSVKIGWSQTVKALELWINDNAPGLADTANLFVRFFTTKPQASGIGLALMPPDRGSA